MNMKARFAIMDMLQAINTLKNFAEESKKNSQQGSTRFLEEEEQLLLKGAFTLMHRTLSALTPLVWSGTHHATTTPPKVPKKPALHLV